MCLLRAALAVIFVGYVSLTTGVVRAATDTCVIDDTRQSVCTSSTVKRVVSLSPHATELVAYVGGLDLLVGVDSASNYPKSVQAIEPVGDSQRVDIEKLLALRPDLVVVWGSGTQPSIINLLRQQKVPVFVSEPTTVQAVADNMVALAILTGRSDASAMASNWVKQFDQLQATYGQRKPVRLFYQVWQSPLMTIGGKHLINDVISLCGGVNVFASLDTLAPTVSLEAVVAGNPELIVTSGDGGRAKASLLHWEKWDQVEAVHHQHFAILPPDVLVRNGPRLIEGAKAMCLAIDEVRR